MKLYRPTLIFLIAGSIGIKALKAQVLPVGTPVLEDYYRREQLMGKIDSSLSFSIRPLSAVALQRKNIYTDDTRLWNDSGSIEPFAKNQGFLQFMPAVWQQQITTKVPYGSWNDGPMIPAKGYQTFLSAGIFAQYKFLSVQFRPEVVIAANGRYEGFWGDVGPSREWYALIGNKIDMPELFGNGTYGKVYWGQSSVRLNFDPISFGISTENLWWGPGRYNSLMMTNTAPGFPHFTFNTTKPIHTGIGSFEGQLAVGKLTASGYRPSLLGDGLYDHYQAYGVDKVDTWRYFSGITLSYQPKWVPGLSLGTIRTLVINHQDRGNGIGDYLPFFGGPTPLEITDGNGNVTVYDHPRIQYSSIFFRYMMPKGHMEFYGEYGRNDKPANTRDLIVAADHSRAYVLGFRKLVDLHHPKGDMIEIGAEATELALSNTILQRGADSWYTHDVVRDGYTQKGQLLGSGIGPGGSIQNVNVSWLRGMKQVGLLFERYSHNEDFFYWNIGDLRRQWVDLSLKAHATWDFNHLVALASVQYIKSYNYEYRFVYPEGVPNDANHFWDFDKTLLGNVQIQLGLMYRF